jgi:hypothetical protein
MPTDFVNNGEGDAPRYLPEGNYRYFWLFPAGLLLHDLEELLAMPSWIVLHADLIGRIAARGRVGEYVAASIRTPFAETAFAIALVVLTAFVLTWVTLRKGASGMAFTLYLVALGMASLHVLVHILQALFTGGYIPGLVLAVGALLPACLYVYRRLFAEGVVTKPAAVLAAFTGIALFVPMVVLVRIVASFVSL